MPKVTVLMPVYNAEKYLAEAIESILEQTFTDFDFLIIDDGSTDRSVEIINSYADNRITLIRNEQNMGISNTLNKGVLLADSDIIARMDADDISLPERLIKQYTYLRDNPDCVLVSTGAETISGDGEILEIFEPNDDFLYYMMTFHCWIYHPSVMYRRKEIIDLDMYPNTRSQDYKLWSKIIRKHKINAIPDILIKYRITSQSVSNYVYKEESMEEELRQVRSNLQYFCGDSYTIPDDWLEAYRNNYTPLTKQPEITQMVDCIRELDHITEHVLAKKNVNKDEKSILSAAKYKKEHLLKGFLKNISVGYRVLLLYKTRNYRKLVKLLFKKPYKKAVRIFTSS